MSDIALANVEALAGDELADNQYFVMESGKLLARIQGNKLPVII